MTHLIALIDGSIYSESVCDHTAWVAKKTDATVELVHVLGRRTTNATGDLSGNLKLGARSSLLEELSDLDEQNAKLALKKGRALLDDAKERLQAAGVTNVTERLRHGDLIEAIQHFETDADLILIGKRGEAADFARLHLGSNLERVVRSATKPVLVASRAFRPVERFLIAYDGGESVEKAVRHIAQGKLFTDIPGTLLHAGPETDKTSRKMEQAAGHLKQAGYSMETVFRAGEPEKVISDAVAGGEYGLVIMGAYGHSRVRNLIIGSTTTEMIRSCLVPVMLFR